MKLVFVLLGLICASQAINQQCAVELAKIGIDVTKLAIDISSAKVIAAALAAVKSYKELKNVIATCQTSEIEASFVEANLMKFRLALEQDGINQYFILICYFHLASIASTLEDLKICIQHLEVFVDVTNDLIAKFKAGDDVLADAFIDEVVQVTELVDGVLLTCKLNKVEKQWKSMLPKNCIEDIGYVVKDITAIKNSGKKFKPQIRNFLNLDTDLVTMKSNCPRL